MFLAVPIGATSPKTVFRTNTANIDIIPIIVYCPFWKSFQLILMEVNVEATEIERVNSLIRKSFGRFYRGNYRILGGGISGGELLSMNRLQVIASKATWLGFGDPAMGVGVKGLLSTDGSRIVAIKNSESSARKYADLYRQEFGREVQVEIRADFYELFPTQGSASQTPFPRL